MGFLIFAFRKLSLRREINQKNYRLMTISTLQNRIQDQISVMEQAKATLQGAWTTTIGSLSTMGSSIFAAGVQGNNVQFQQYQNQLLQLDVNDPTYEDQKDQIEAQMILAQNSAQTEYDQKYAQYQAYQQGIVLANQVQNSIFATVDQASLSLLHSQDDSYDLEKANLESQLEKLNAEYESVEKAEGQAAKQAAPTFGLG